MPKEIKNKGEAELPRSPQFRMAVLGSGSGGNAVLVECGESRILIDIGLSAKQIVLRLQALEIDPDSLSGVLLTHEHGDHARGLDVFLRQRAIPVYANALTREAMSWNLKSEVRWRVFEVGESFRVGEFEVSALSIPHDAADPVAFVVEVSGVRMGLLTDVGHVTYSLKEGLKGLDVLCVESNYDEALLEKDEKRPWSTKQRIASKHGHLSNKQAGEFVAEVASEKLEEVMLLHLSGDCNDPELARNEIKGCLSPLGYGKARVHCASQAEPTDWIVREGRVLQSPEIQVDVDESLLEAEAEEWEQGQLF